MPAVFTCAMRHAVTHFWHVPLHELVSHSGAKPRPPVNVTALPALSCLVIERFAGSAHLTRYDNVFCPAAVAIRPLLPAVVFAEARPLPFKGPLGVIPFTFM